jgi:chemotaxis protein histidine kinase CheA
VLYHGKVYILHIEFESGADQKMRSRLLAYNAILHLEYDKPVISLIIYPFRTTTAESPLVIWYGDEEMLRFQFFVLPLFQQEAERYLEKHITCMYPLLPAMKGANETMIVEAMAELAALYRDDEVSLAQQLVWMEILLARTTTISPEEKTRIQEGLKMYDPLWEEHPKVKKIKAQARAEVKQAKIEARIEARLEAQAEAERAKAEAQAEAERAKAEALAEVERAKAELQAEAERTKAELQAEAERTKAESLAEAERTKAEAERARLEALAEAERAKAQVKMAQIEAQAKLCQDIITIVQTRFPELTELAKQTIDQNINPGGLNVLLLQLATAANAAVARCILRPSEG